QFLEAAQTPGFIAATAKLGAIRRGITWIGVRVAFVFFRLGFSANQVSLIGWLFGICGLGLFCCDTQLPHWCAILAVVCCYGGAFVDFCDGSVARARKSASKLGDIIDGITTDFIRSGLLVVLGVVSGSAAYLIAGLVSGYIVVSLRNQFFTRRLLTADAPLGIKWAASMLRWAFSVHMMIGALPLLFAAAIYFDRVQCFAKSILAIYLALSLAWFWLACRAVQREATRTSATREDDTH
ncbi:MAG: CDP-alcohol phosphatidyltransferase family protein, partial [Terracidiphilus sp.]